MIRARKMCKSCPFRGADDATKRECAAIPADHWPCHTEARYVGYSEVQCRGHWEAVRRFGGNYADSMHEPKLRLERQ